MLHDVPAGGAPCHPASSLLCSGAGYTLCWPALEIVGPCAGSALLLWSADCFSHAFVSCAVDKGFCRGCLPCLGSTERLHVLC